MYSVINNVQVIIYNLRMFLLRNKQVLLIVWPFLCLFNHLIIIYHLNIQSPQTCQK